MKTREAAVAELLDLAEQLRADHGDGAALNALAKASGALIGKIAQHALNNTQPTVWDKEADGEAADASKVGRLPRVRVPRQQKEKG